MTVPVSAPAAASALAGAALLAMIPLALRYRHVPGAVGWFGLLATTGGWALLYGVALTVFDPSLRVLFEIPQYLAMSSAVVFLVVAGLSYTGFGGLVHSRWMVGLIGLAGAFWLLIATNALGLHSLVWSDYEVVPVAGAAAARFDPTPIFYLIVAVAYTSIAAIVVLVFETMLRYKPLYRHRVALLLIAGAPVGLANLHWLVNLTWPEAGVGPLAGLDLTPIAFLVTAAVDGYVIYTGDFFEVAPATSRIAERVAFDDLSTAVVLVNEAGLVVGMNATAAELFDVDDRTAALETPYAELTGTELPAASAPPETVTFSSAPSRTYEVSMAPIHGDDGRVHGHTVTIKDVTRQRRRQQRLEVLNRVMRHNLRNDMTVIEGNASHIAERIPDDGAPAAGTDVGTTALPDLDGVADASQLILETSRSLRRTADKARDVASISPDATVAGEHIDVGGFVERLADESRERYPDAAIEADAPEGLVAETDPATLRLVLANLVENAVVHNDAEEPHVAIEAEERAADDGSDAIAITVTDDGPGIPDHELDVIEAGAEDQLEHGSGLGLWIVTWGVEDLGGTVGFDNGDGTTVTLTLPQSTPEV